MTDPAQTVVYLPGGAPALLVTESVDDVIGILSTAREFGNALVPLSRASDDEFNWDGCAVYVRAEQVLAVAPYMRKCPADFDEHGLLDWALRAR